MIRSFSILIILCCALTLISQENRTINGSGNNLNTPELGSQNDLLLRKATVNYFDGITQPNDAHLPIPRKISNDLFAQSESIYEASNLSDYVWVFGQFLDHDISLVSGSHESVGLTMPDDESFFNQPGATILTERSIPDPSSGLTQGNPRQYRNEVTSFIDGSMIYGSSTERANWLRSFESGKLRVSNDSIGTGDLLPWNTLSNNYNNSSIDLNAPKMESRLENKFFVAGDVRANENPLLLSLHTLFVREHNRLCDELSDKNPDWSDEELYQRARKYVGAYLQAITYYEWLPQLDIYLPEYKGYREEVLPQIFNVFDAAAFKIGHSMINSKIVVMDNDGLELPGEVNVNEVYFKPVSILSSRGIETYFKGMGTQIMQELDCKMIDDLRNFQLNNENQDLAAISIYRGRDRGVPDYNTLRQDFGLAPVTTFEQISDDQTDMDILKNLYGDVNNIDAWVGMLSEKHVSENAIFGELFMRIIKEQFDILRYGDRFYFENDNAFSDQDILDIKETTLHDIIMRNTDITLMQPDVFSAMAHTDIPNGPSITRVSLDGVVYPNPVLDYAIIKLYSADIQQVSYKIYNSNGQIMSTATVDLEVGENFMDLDIDPAWPRGLYSCLIESEDNFSLIKIIKE